MTAARKDLARELRTADEERLLELVLRHREDLGPREVEQVLRNPFVTPQILDLLGADRALLSAYQVRRALAAHPRTPEVDALRLIQGLYWHDLVRIGRDSRLRPTVRRAADRRLALRLPALTVGEKIAIARGAGSGLIALLRTEPDARVMRALLENPRLTEAALAPVVFADATPAEVLETVGRDARWTCRPVIRQGLCRNRRTPVSTVLPLLPLLAKSELSKVSRDRRLASEVRHRAALLSGRGST